MTMKVTQTIMGSDTQMAAAPDDRSSHVYSVPLAVVAAPDNSIL